jgi:WD40 repeat protein/uncharacterized caspase-like protein
MTEQLETPKQLPFEQHHAFIIGIDNYQQVSPLQTAVNDARKLAEVLKEQHGFNAPALLLDAKGEEIRHLLQTLPKQVKENNRVVFYFAGHGVAADGEDGPAGYLVPADADPTDVKTFIPMEDLHQQLDALPCRHLLLILDCCFSGAFKWSSQHRASGTLMPRKIFKERFDRFIKDRAWQVITSAASDQKALDVLRGEGLRGKVTGDRGVKESPEGAHSPFALALFAGLQGDADIKVGQEGDGVITATELYAYIRDQIEPATIKESQKLRQTPGFFPLRRHDKGEFIFLHPRHRLNLPAQPKRNPYKGLQSFDETDKELFYGRDRVIAELRAKAESNKLLVVSGASGTGKSSVIKAGLLPVLRDEGFRILPVIRPGVSPMASLEKGLKDAKVIDGSASLQDGAFIAKLGEQKTVLLIDQYEELITRCPNPAEREQFDALLRKLLDEVQDGALKIILTVRADFEPQLDDGALKSLWTSGRCTVPPFSVEELKEVIVMPTIQEVLIFDPPELVDEIIEEVVQAPGALPLLSYTLSELYEAYIKSGRQDRALKKEDYDNLGGVMGALRTKADALYQNLDTGSQNTMRKIMLRMVSLEGELAGKRVLMDELIYADAAENQRVHAVIDQLVEARLIVKGKDYVEPAHDALVRAWKMLREWIHAIGEDKILLNTKVNVAANEYAESQNVKFLWNDNPHLNVLQQDLSKPNQWFNGKEITFIQKSLQRKQKLSRILRSTIAGVIIALSGLTAWALWKQYEATQNYKKEKAGRLAIVAKEVLPTDNTKALRLAEAGYAILEKHPPPDVSQVLSEVFHSQDSALFYTANFPHEEPVNAAVFSPDGRRILTADEGGLAMLWDLQGNLLRRFKQDDYEITDAVFGGNDQILTLSRNHVVRLWGANGKLLDTLACDKSARLANFAADGKQIRVAIDHVALPDNAVGNLLESLKHDKEITTAVFSPDGKNILTASKDHTAKLWELSQKFVHRLSHHENGVNTAVISPDGKRFLTAAFDNKAKLWDEQGRGIDSLMHADAINMAIFSPEGWRVLTAGRDSVAKLWAPRAKKVITLLHHGAVNSAVFSPAAGEQILTASADSTAKLWSSEGAALHTFQLHSEVNSALFSPDGEYVLTVANDSAAKIWAKNGILLETLQHHDVMNQATFSPDGRRVLTASADSTAMLWQVDGRRLAAFKHHSEVKSAIFSPDGRFILTADADGIAKLWKANGSFVDSFEHHSAVTAATFSPDSKLILTASRNEDESDSAKLWNLQGELLADFKKHADVIKCVAFSPDGKRAITASNDGNAMIWWTPAAIYEWLKTAPVYHLTPAEEIQYQIR